MEDYSCDYCGSEPDSPNCCMGCEEVYCESHRPEDDHYCGEHIVVLKQGEGNIHGLKVPNGMGSLVKRFEGKGLIRAIIQALLVSPVTLSFLVLMLVWSIIEFATFGYLSEQLWKSIFIFSSENPLYVWTWLTSIFSHGGIIHLLVNGVVLAMFGPIAEKQLGRKKFFFLFIIGGILAGIVQVYYSVLFGGTAAVVGASGAIGAVLGAHSTRSPNVKVYFLGLIPMPLLVAVGFFGLGSLAVVAYYGASAFGIAHLSHATGIIFGFIVGIYGNTQHIRKYLKSLPGV